MCIRDSQLAVNSIPVDIRLVPIYILLLAEKDFNIFDIRFNGDDQKVVMLVK